MSLMRSSGEKRSLGVGMASRRTGLTVVPNPCPASYRNPYHS